MAKVTDLVAQLAQPLAEAAGCSLWDVEYVREAGTWFLRVYIDKEGGVSIDDCVELSRRLNPLLDEADPIPQAYCMEVSSPGLNRELVKPAHFAAFEGWPVMVKLYHAADGNREVTGRLLGLTTEGLSLETADGIRLLAPGEYAAVHLQDDGDWEGPDETEGED